jgi:hypothetical protein
MSASAGEGYVLMTATLTMPQDTPITRASMEVMTVEQMEEHVSRMRERRMRVFSAWQEAQEKAHEVKLAKDREQIAKRLAQMEKVFVTVDNGLKKLEAYTAEVKVLRMAGSE